MNFENFLLTQNLDAASRAINAWKVKTLIEELEAASGASVVKNAVLMAEVTGCRISDIGDLRCEDFDRDSGKVTVRLTKERGISGANIKRYALERVRKHRKDTAFTAKSYEYYVSLDRMDLSDLEADLTAQESIFVANSMAELCCCELERYLPKDLISRYEAYDSKFLFPVKATGSNRAKSLDQPISRQTIWRTASQLPSYKDRLLCDRPLSLRDPLYY